MRHSRKTSRGGTCILDNSAGGQGDSRYKSRRVGCAITDTSLAEQCILDTSPGGQGDSRYKTRRVGWAITDNRLAEQVILDNSAEGHGDSRYKSRRVWWAITIKSLAGQGILDKRPGGQGDSRYTHSFPPHVLPQFANVFACTDNWPEFLGHIADQISEATFGLGLFIVSFHSILADVVCRTHASLQCVVCLAHWHAHM